MALSDKKIWRLVWVGALGTIPHKALQVYVGSVGGNLIEGKGASQLELLLLVTAGVSAFLIVYLTKKELKSLTV